MYEIHIQAQVQDVNFQECGEINTNVQFSGARNVGIPVCHPKFYSRLFQNVNMLDTKILAEWN